MSHWSTDMVIDQVIDEVADMTSKEVIDALFERKIVLHYSEVARDVLADKLFEEKMEASPY